MAVSHSAGGANSSKASHLLLFDVDGTLLSCGRQVRGLFLGALEAVFGVSPDPRGFDFSGRTDPEIVLGLLARAGLSEADVTPRLGAMHDLYRERLDAGLRREEMRLLPGVVPLLERLASRADLAVGLLTGNWRRCADVKLGRFELGRFFRFGAFGDDAVARRDLVPVALERARAATGRAFTPEETIIIGDSVRDVDCARAAGAACLAVTTGFTSAEALHEAGADWVVDDLLCDPVHPAFADEVRAG